MTSRKYVSIFVARIKLYYIAFAKSLVAKRQKEGMLYPAVAHWNSKCFWEIVRRRIQLATTNIIATAIVNFLIFFIYNATIFKQVGGALLS